MHTVTKISLGLAAAAVVVVGPLALIAGAQDSSGQDSSGQDLRSQPSASAWPDGSGPGGGYGRGMGRGMGGGMGGGMGMMNGTGPGAAAMVDYLAAELGVAEDDVAAALRQWHVDHPATMRGWERSRADAESHHEAMADFLAERLGVGADAVEAALDARLAGGCRWR